MNENTDFATAIRELVQRLQSGECCWGDFLRACPKAPVIAHPIRNIEGALLQAFEELREAARFGHDRDPDGSFNKLHTVYMMEVEVAYGHIHPDFFMQIGR